MIPVSILWYHSLTFYMPHTWSRIEWRETAGKQAWNHNNSLDICCHDCIPTYTKSHSCFVFHFFSVPSLSAQGCASARRECMDPSVMSATQASSASAARAASPASVTTTPATVTHSPVSVFKCASASNMSGLAC